MTTLAFTPRGSGRRMGGSLQRPQASPTHKRVIRLVSPSLARPWLHGHLRNRSRWKLSPSILQKREKCESRLLPTLFVILTFSTLPCDPSESFLPLYDRKTYLSHECDLFLNPFYSYSTLDGFDPEGEFKKSKRSFPPTLCMLFPHPFVLFMPRFFSQDFSRQSLDTKQEQLLSRSGLELSRSSLVSLEPPWRHHKKSISYLVEYLCIMLTFDCLPSSLS